MAKQMGRYCKAYPAEAFRAYPGWVEKIPPLHISADEKNKSDQDHNQADESEPEELDYYYLQEDYTVTAGIFLEEQVAFDDVTQDWKEFCTNTLEFHLPKDEPVEATSAETTTSVA